MNKSAILAELLLLLNKEAGSIKTTMDYHREQAIEAEGRMVSRYDSTKAEMSYLADGHQVRLIELNRLIATLKNLGTLGTKSVVEVGALVTIAKPEQSQTYLILPGGAGRTVVTDGEKIIIISPHSPLFAAMRGSSVGDEVKTGKTIGTIESIA